MKKVIKVIKVFLSVVSVACGLFCVTGVLVYGSEGEWSWAIGTGIVAALLLVAPVGKKLMLRLQKSAYEHGVPMDDAPADDAVAYPWEEDPTTAGVLRSGQKRASKPAEENKKTIEL